MPDKNTKSKRPVVRRTSPTRCSTFLRWAEEALRDIADRCEHSGTNARCRKEVAQIAANYWFCKSNAEISGEKGNNRNG